MPPFTKLLICPSRRNSAGGPGLDSGYALLFVMMAATVLLVSLTAVLPSIYQEGQREREQELIFRGTQYARAIASFHQKFQRYPTSVEELTKLTNGWRFLRKEFADPMTPNGKWRFIHANAQGVLLDSKTQGPASGGQGQPGAGQGAGGFGMSGPSSMGGSAFGQRVWGEVHLVNRMRAEVDLASKVWGGWIWSVNGGILSRFQPRREPFRRPGEFRFLRWGQPGRGNVYCRRCQHQS